MNSQAAGHLKAGQGSSSRPEAGHSLLPRIWALLLSGFALPVHSQSFDLATFERVKQSVLHISSTQCTDGSSRTAGGFLWSSATQIVTALHVVAGCTNISVYSEIANISQSASVSRALISEDLALLTVQSPFSGAQIIKRAANLAPAGQLEVVGYSFNRPSADNTSLKLRFGGHQLKDIVPAEVAQRLKQIGSPSPDIVISDIEGNLLPGDSGSPIVDSQGNVVAIADGGLEGGTVGVSWGIPAAQLDDLSTSSDSTTVSFGTIGSQLFAVEQSSSLGNAVQCGTQQFTQVRTITGADIRLGTDDLPGFDQLVAASGIQDIAALRFDVYQQLQSGATFVVPAGAGLTQDGATCIATSPSGKITVRVQSTGLSALDPIGAQAAFQFEGASFSVLGQSGSTGWSVNGAWTYPIFHQRFDGLAVMRKGLGHFEPTPFGAVPDADYHETLAIKRGYFLGASAIEQNFSFQLSLAQHTCLINPAASPACPQVSQDALFWAEAVLSVHAATFPIG